MRTQCVHSAPCPVPSQPRNFAPALPFEKPHPQADPARARFPKPGAGVPGRSRGAIEPAAVWMFFCYSVIYKFSLVDCHPGPLRHPAERERAHVEFRPWKAADRGQGGRGGHRCGLRGLGCLSGLDPVPVRGVLDLAPRPGSTAVTKTDSFRGVRVARHCGIGRSWKGPAFIANCAHGNRNQSPICGHISPRLAILRHSGLRDCGMFTRAHKGTGAMEPLPLASHSVMDRSLPRFAVLRFRDFLVAVEHYTLRACIHSASPFS